jgi:hypothetical protein
MSNSFDAKVERVLADMKARGLLVEVKPGHWQLTTEGYAELAKHETKH